MSDITVKMCDFCNRQISSYPGRNNAFLALQYPKLYIVGDYQTFLTSDGFKDACGNCCYVISVSLDCFGFELDTTGLLALAGYERDDEGWLHDGKRINTQGAKWQQWL